MLLPSYHQLPPLAFRVFLWIEKQAGENRNIKREWRIVATGLLPFKGITLRHAFGHILMLRAVSRGHGYLVHGMLKSYWFIWRGGITNEVNARRMDCEYFPRLVRLCRPTGARKDSEMTQCTELEYQNAVLLRPPSFVKPTTPPRIPCASQ